MARVSILKSPDELTGEARCIAERIVDTRKSLVRTHPLRIGHLRRGLGELPRRPRRASACPDKCRCKPHDNESRRRNSDPPSPLKQPPCG